LENRQAAEVKSSSTSNLNRQLRFNGKHNVIECVLKEGLLEFKPCKTNCNYALKN